MRYLGGGHKRRFRFIDFKRNKDGVPARVKSIEYDPNRSARIALLYYVDVGNGKLWLTPCKLACERSLETGPNIVASVGDGRSW